jgi:heptosyltransferase-3
MASPSHEIYDNVRRLLIVRDDRLGDLTLTLPAIDRLRAAYPEAVIGLLVRPELAPLANMFAPVDRVLETGGDMSGTIRDFAPDAAVCISRRPAAPRALRKAGVRRVTGSGRRWFSYLFDRCVVASRRASVRHELEHALDLAALAGAVQGPLRFPIEIPVQATRQVAQWLEEHGVVGDPLVLHPGTAGSCPGWAPARWRQLAALLHDAKYPVVITEGPADRAAMAAFADSELPRFAAGLPELAALLSRACLMLGNSTGPLHLASALGRPALAIHAPWKSCSAERWGPYRDNGWALVIEHPDARRWSRRRRRRSADWLMDQLPVETVYRAVDSMLARGQPQIGP